MGCGELSSASRVETLRCGERDVLIWTWRVEASSGTCWKPLGGDVFIEPTRSPAVGAAKAGDGARARAAREEACGGKGAPRLPTRGERRAPQLISSSVTRGMARWPLLSQCTSTLRLAVRLLHTFTSKPEERPRLLDERAVGRPDSERALGIMPLALPLAKRVLAAAHTECAVV